MHDVNHWPSVTQFLSHFRHYRPNVFEETPVTLTQVVEAEFSFWSTDKSVPGTLTVADKTKITIAAVFWQARFLSATKLLLALTISQFENRLLVYVAQLVFGFDEVITTIEIAVVFERQAPATVLLKDTK
jgi:hypothetical protein